MAPKKQVWRFKAFESATTNGRWLRIAGDMLDSLAWKQLSVYEQVLYLHIKNKFRVNKVGESNERNISFTYSEGQKLMSKRTFTQSIDRLIELGFVDLVEHWRHAKKPTIYGLSARWRDYGTDKFEEKRRPKARCPYRGGPRRTE